MGPFLIIILVLVVGFAIAWAVHLHEKKRADLLAGFAERIGFAFDPSKDRSHDDRYARFDVFRKGHSRAAFNTMTGRVEIGGADHSVVMGDFLYRITNSNGKSTSTHTYKLSYLILHLPYRGVPDLTIKPEGFFSKIGQALGFDDIDMEDAEFSRMFVVRSGDRRFAYDVCHPRMIEWLKRHARNFPAIDMEGGAICLAANNKRWDPAEFERTMRYAQEFVGQWPEHLVAELRGAVA